MTSIQLPEKYNHICEKYGNPITSMSNGIIKVNMDWAYKNTTVIVWVAGNFSTKIYIHKALEDIMERTGEYFSNEHPDFVKVIGCFNPRMKATRQEPSVHTWALAVDINPAYNKLTGGPDRTIQDHPQAFTKEMFEDMRALGWDCGYYWNSICDRMHFQLKGLGV